MTDRNSVNARGASRLLMASGALVREISFGTQPPGELNFSWDGLTDSGAAALQQAYEFLRRLENFIQAIRDRQTHDLPTDSIDRARLCLAMGYASWDELLGDLNAHRDAVTREFDAVAFREREHADQRGQKLTDLWDAAAPAETWEEALRAAGFAHADTIAKKIAAFAAAPSTRQADKESSRRLRTFIPELLQRIGETGDPVTAISRVLAMVEKILRRSAYIALLNENPAVLSRLVNLCERSAYIAGQIALYPVLLDELLDPSVQSSPLTLEEQDSELSARLADCPPGDSEAQIAALGQFQRANSSAWRSRISLARCPS